MSRVSVIALDQLPRMAVLETIDTEAIIAARKVRIKDLWAAGDPPAAALWDTDGLEFSPIVIQVEAATYFELMLRDRVNQAARAVTLAFGSGSDLDAIASRYPGGVPRLANESDDHYRRRIWLSPNLLTPHGTSEAYEFWALTADPDLRDASASTIEGSGDVTVTVLAEGDEPKPALSRLLAVRGYILDQARKGLTDALIVRPPTVIETDYRVRIWLYPGPDRATVVAAVVASLVALKEKLRWLGADHTLLKLYDAIAVDGVHHAVIDTPTGDVNADMRSIVRVNSIDVQYVGRAQ